MDNTNSKVLDEAEDRIEHQKPSRMSKLLWSMIIASMILLLISVAYGGYVIVSYSNEKAELNEEIAYLREGADQRETQIAVLSSALDSLGVTVEDLDADGTRISATPPVISVAGSDGRDGVDGADGSDGKPGPPGIEGERGPSGETGATGGGGQTGPPGDSGSTGPQGETGEQGPQGPTGPQGPQGPQGPPGPVGSFPSEFFIDYGGVVYRCVDDLATPTADYQCAPAVPEEPEA